MNKNIWVTKSSGNQAKFSKSKLRRSLKKSGASEKRVQEIILEIEKILYPGISTKQIYKKAFFLLRKTSRPYAAKYKLKNALLELGPSGFPFEKYIAEVMKHDGYKVKIGKSYKGKCVNHEVDVTAEKNGNIELIECKFHSDERNLSGVKIPLYIHSRYKDIHSAWSKNFKNKKLNSFWIITNTRFSKDAMNYANCIGLYMVSWSYPSKGSLKERIDSLSLHPVTCLTTITSREKNDLLKNEIVLCRYLCKDESQLRAIKISERRINKIMNEARALCQN